VAESVQIALLLGSRESLLPALEASIAVLGAVRSTQRQRIADLLAEGHRGSLEQAADLARSALGAIAVIPPRVQEVPLLTRREREVAELLARGMSNRQISDALVIGERTTEMHVSNILAKLGLASRAQVAVWAATRGLGGLELEATATALG
jgi:DNA-binding NarL/FixJ family response regulator